MTCADLLGEGEGELTWEVGLGVGGVHTVDSKQRAHTPGNAVRGTRRLSHQRSPDTPGGRTNGLECPLFMLTNCYY